MKETKKRHLNERESTVMSYVASVLLHALLLLIILALFGKAGGAASGGSESGKILPIGVVSAPGLPASETSVAQPAETIEKPPENVPTESPVKIKEKPEEKKPEKKPSQLDKIKPRAIDGEGTNTKNPDKQGAESHGKGGVEANNNVGEGAGGSGKGEGNQTGDGDGAGIFPFPIGIFNLSPGLVPDCKKNDADNDNLKFKYAVTYGKKSLTVIFANSSSAADPSTIAQTRRVIEMNFASGALDENKKYEGSIECRCGAYPKCTLK
ncbi:MAG: hypothetical protein WCX65_07605 [bacterium]